MLSSINDHSIILGHIQQPYVFRYGIPYIVALGNKMYSVVWRLKLPANRLFCQQFVNANTGQNQSSALFTHYEGITDGFPTKCQ